MYLYGIGSSDPRFKALSFHEGMNIVLAEKIAGSDERNSRNGAGKSSLVLIMRYLLGGERLDKKLSKVKELMDVSFHADVQLTPNSKAERISRSPNGDIVLGPTGNDVSFSLVSPIERAWWLNQVARSSYGLNRYDGIPSLDNLYGQVFRTCFEATKVEPSEAGWKGTTRLGYFMGFSPDVIAESREVANIGGQKRAVARVRSSGAMGGMLREAPEISADLVGVNAQRARLLKKAKTFRVDEQYAEHQDRADELTRLAQRINDQMLMHKERLSAVQVAMEEEEAVDESALLDKVERVYEEAGIALPSVVLRRYEQVKAFHQSVTRNRKLYLEDEASQLRSEIDRLGKELSAVDKERAEVMQLLDSSMALEAFNALQRDIAELDAKAKLLESQLETAKQIDALSSNQTLAIANASTHLQRQTEELIKPIGVMVKEFKDLCSEIYQDREATLSISVSASGNLSIRPKITGDNSRGIGGVKTFLLDMVVLRNAMRLGRAPKLIAHDSELFDAMDERQLGSCLNIAARLSRAEDFQYILLLNSDKLDAAERNGFDRAGYVIEPTLSDSGEDGGLFGFRFA